MFIVPTDFYAVYTKERFITLINSDHSIWRKDVKTATETIKGYLRSRYDTSQIFKELQLYSTLQPYTAGDWIYVYADDYSETTYEVNDLATYQGDVYICIVQVATAETFDAEKWQKISAEYAVFEVITDTPAGTLPTDTHYFSDDPRNPKIVELTVDIVLYNILGRLNNIDIPTNRKERYDGNSDKQTGGAIGYLKDVAKGLIKPDLPLIVENQEDQTGNVVIYGSASETETNYETF